MEIGKTLLHARLLADSRAVAHQKWSNDYTCELIERCVHVFLLSDKVTHPNWDNLLRIQIKRSTSVLRPVTFDH